MNTIQADVVIIGTGCAGLSCALAMPHLDVHVITKSVLRSGATLWAQGGIAAAVGADDDPELHATDTVNAAAGLADIDAVGVLTQSGPAQISRLERLGTRFDKTADTYALGKEAAHGRHRILHANGDSTGAELSRSLSEAARAASHITVHEGHFAGDLVLENGHVVGITATAPGHPAVCFRAAAVVLASGGAGQLFARTTNPVEATADGLAMALRAGAAVIDVEFVQFHPTALQTERDPLPLLTEALRGEGATLLNSEGDRFMVAIHPDAELAPRDVVARGIRAQHERGQQVVLDATDAVGHAFPERFPTVWRHSQSAGIDPRTEPIPVTPAVHYHMGGVAVDLHGQTSLDGLWACGEVSCTGVHGANRLASNSLLEGLVFGERVAEAIARTVRGGHRELLETQEENGPRPRRIATDVQPPSARFAGTPLESQLRDLLRRTMWNDVGLARTQTSLERALLTLDQIASEAPAGAGELRNMLDASRAIATAALLRTESRGGHYRVDCPDTDPDQAVRTRLQRSPAGEDPADPPVFRLQSCREQ